MNRAHCQEARTLSKCLPLLFVALLCASSAFALDPSLDISQYAHSAWKVRDGFVPGAISYIAQTSDGYLWLATEFGLADSVSPLQGSSAKFAGAVFNATARMAAWETGSLTYMKTKAAIFGQAVIRAFGGEAWFPRILLNAPAISRGRFCRG